MVGLGGDMAKPKLQPPCKKCGSKEFSIRYTETAHARVAQDGDVLYDGENLVHHEKDWDQAWCASCGEKVKWVGERD